MKKIKYVLGAFVIVLQVFLSPLATSAETLPSGTKSFSPVGSSNGKWNDGISLGGSYLKIDSEGIITGFAKDADGNEWNGQKFKNVTDNKIAYCLNFNQKSPDGSSNPLDNLTSEQKRQLGNLLKLGYVENGTEVYKGQGVTTLSNIDAFTTTQWMVHEIVPTWDMSEFTITNPQLAAGVANLRQWINEDLSIQLQKVGTMTKAANVYSQKYKLTAPHDLTGEATILLSKNIEGAKIVTSDGTFDISSTKGQKVDVGDTFTITVPSSAPTDSVDILAKGGTTSFTFMKYDRPSTDQQQALVVGDQYISDDETAKAAMAWETTVPKIGTTATDKADGDKAIDPIKQASITDTVKYEGLTPGKAYTMKGVLMDKATGKPLVVNGKQVTAQTTFTPKAASGTVTLTFTFDASSLKGKTLVVFENAYQSGKEVASHENINDKGQTIIVTNPKIGTSATDKADGDKVLDPDKKVTINDTVKYEGLTIGKTYTIKGVLMDKATGKPLVVNGKQVTAQTTFTPKTAKGTVTVAFTFDASKLKGKTLVVFEKAYQNGKEVASHENINDKGQTISIRKPAKLDKTPITKNKNKTPTNNQSTNSPSQSQPKSNKSNLSYPQTSGTLGSMTVWYTLFGLLILTSLGYLVYVKRKKHN